MAGPALANPNLGYRFDMSTMPIGAGERQRLEQHRSHDAEDDGVAAETDDERRQHGEREAALAGPASYRKSRVTQCV